MGLVRPVEMAHSCLQSRSRLFPVWLSLEFSGPTSRSGDIDHFNLENHF